MQAIFAKAQQSINTILIFVAGMAVLSLTAQFFIKTKLKKSNRSDRAKRAFGDLAVIVVWGIGGMIMIFVLANQK